MGPAGWVLLALVAGAAAMAARRAQGRRAQGRRGRWGRGSGQPAFWPLGGYDGLRDDGPDRLMRADAKDRDEADDGPDEAAAASDAEPSQGNRARDDEAGSEY